jgi:hypothetical protein
LDPDVAQHIGYPRDRRTHLGLEFVLLSVLVVDGVLYRGDSQFVLANLDGQIGTHLLNVGAKAEIARDCSCSYRQQEHGSLKQVTEVDFRAESRPKALVALIFPARRS